MGSSPSIETFTISNGLPVVIASGPHLHRTAIACMVEVGARYEDASIAGVSHFLEHMLHRGTPSFPSAHALASGIESLGASLDAATGVEHGSLVLTSPPETALDALEVLGEVVTNPLFHDVEVERGIVREELLEDRDERGRLVDPDGIVRTALFGEHPLGYPIVGTPKTLARFDVPLLERHHARHYTAKTSVLAIAGRVPPRARLERVVERAFAQVPRGRKLPVQRFRRDARRSAPELKITRTSSSQASLRVACLGPGRRNARAPVADLLLRIIDDGNATRLYEALCDRRGLCYEVSAGYEPYLETGLFDVAAEAQEGAIGEVLSTVLSMFRELATSGPSDAEIDKAVHRARWQAARSLDQPESIAEQAAVGLLSSEPLTASERAERIATRSRSDVRALARQMFRPEMLGVAVVGAVSRSTERELREIMRRFSTSASS